MSNLEAPQETLGSKKPEVKQAAGVWIEDFRPGDKKCIEKDQNPFYDDDSASDDSDEAEDEGQADEDEEGEDEDEEEEEEEEEEAEVEEEVYAGKTQEEIEAELQEMHTQLLNKYIMAKIQLKYERKRNAYFQDRIYRTSVRKGIIIEAELVAEEAAAAAAVKNKSRKRHLCLPTTTEEETEEEESILGPEGKKRKKRKHRRHKQEEDISSALGKRGIGEKFANDAKYQKLLRKILKLQRLRAQYLEHHQVTLQSFSDKCQEWSAVHVEYLNKLLEEIKFQSEFAVDSNTGKRIPRHETEEYCGELSRIHKKLCETMLQMYKSRRGLEFTLKRLRESEIQEGEGIEILEYEQLRDENGSLKDRLGDRVKDVESIQDKILYAIQIMGHLRSKMFNMNQGIAEGEEYLVTINQGVFDARANGEQIMKQLLQIRRQERALVVDSGLLDNPLLLRDYEDTGGRVLEMKLEKKRLERILLEGSREFKDMDERKAELRKQYPQMFERKWSGKKGGMGVGTGELKCICTNTSSNPRP